MIGAVKMMQSVAEGVLAVVGLISLLLAIGGAVVAYAQWRRHLSESRAKFLKSLLEEFYNTEMVGFFLDVDYGKFKYANFHGGPYERITDKALSLASYICYLKNTGVITGGEFRFFQYDIDRLARNIEILKYMHFLYHFAKQNSTAFSYQCLYDHGKSMKFFDSEAFEKE